MRIGNAARLTVDLSPAQRAALDEMISKYNTEVCKVQGLELRIGMGEFIPRAYETTRRCHWRNLAG
jgi:hypothetical protein